MGPCAGGAVYSPAITDFIFMVEDSAYMFVTGPKVVQTVTGEIVTAEQLGGAKIHSTRSGVSHFLAKDDETNLLLIRKLLSYMPSNNLEEAPIIECNDPIDRLEDALNEIIPENPNQPYDIVDVIWFIWWIIYTNTIIFIESNFKSSASSFYYNETKCFS